MRRYSLLLLIPCAVFAAAPAAASGMMSPTSLQIFETSEWFNRITDQISPNLSEEEQAGMRAAMTAIRTSNGKTGGAWAQLMNPPKDGVTREEARAAFDAAYDLWLRSLELYIDGSRALPISVDIVLEDGSARFASPPELPELEAGLYIQPIFVHVRPPEGGGQPLHREQHADLTAETGISIAVTPGRDNFVVLNLSHLPEGKREYRLDIFEPGGSFFGSLMLPVTARPGGQVEVEVIDAATGKPTPARIGLYGPGGFIQPEETITLFVHEWDVQYRHVQGPCWPSDDNRAFYTTGRFGTAVPAGKCMLVVRKGLEYRMVDETFEVSAGETVRKRIVMERWADMPAKGWYSGDDHCHVRRNGNNNVPIMRWAQAEDVHVTNIVQMGDIKRLHFLQYAWGDAGMAVDGDYVLRTGQEDPRTFVNGHTLMFNIRNGIHDNDLYYIYADAFDQAHAVGGMTGYAHWGDFAGAERGLSVDVALGKVDFVEVHQFHKMNLEVLYHFWDLGFRLTPTAGSDFPWGSTIGQGAMYVYVDGPFSFDAWYAGLQAGHTFVTDGPMLSFRVNGELPGGETALSEPGDVAIEVSAKVNPTLDRLERLEIVKAGEVVATVEAVDGGAETLEKELRLPFEESAWVALRAYGGKTQAHTAAVYVTVGSAPTWTKEKLAQSLERAEGKLQEFEQEMNRDLACATLKANAPRLRQLIGEARAVYAGMKEKAAGE